MEPSYILNIIRKYIILGKFFFCYNMQKGALGPALECACTCRCIGHSSWMRMCVQMYWVLFVKCIYARKLATVSDCTCARSWIGHSSWMRMYVQMHWALFVNAHVHADALTQLNFQSMVPFSSMLHATKCNTYFVWKLLFCYIKNVLVVTLNWFHISPIAWKPKLEK